MRYGFSGSFAAQQCFSRSRSGFGASRCVFFTGDGSLISVELRIVSEKEDAPDGGNALRNGKLFPLPLPESYCLCYNNKKLSAER